MKQRSCQYNVFHSCNKTGDYFVVTAETCLWQLKIQLANSLLHFERISCPSIRHNQHHLQVLYKRICTRKRIKYSQQVTAVFFINAPWDVDWVKWGKVLSSFLGLMTVDDLFSSHLFRWEQKYSFSPLKNCNKTKCYGGWHNNCFMSLWMSSF